MEVFSDFACPYCYLAELGLVTLEPGLEVRYRSFELFPAPAPLSHPGSDPMKRQAFETMIAPRAAEYGVAVRFPEFGVRTRKAHEAAKFARSRGLERPMRNALFEAYFVGNRDIGRIDVLIEIAERAGLERGELQVSLGIDQLTDEVVEDEMAAAAMRLRGVPAYMDEQLNPRMLVGLHDNDRLRAWLETRR